MPVTNDEVLRALSVVTDPDLGRDLVTLGMIENVNIDQTGNVSFTIVLTTPACPVKEQLKQQSESVVSAIPGVREVTAEVTSRVRNGTMEQRQGIPGVRKRRTLGRRCLRPERAFDDGHYRQATADLRGEVPPYRNKWDQTDLYGLFR